MTAVTAAWPLDRLVAALARSGWDTLAGRSGGAPRSILRALADLLPHGSATGQVTAHQLAEAAGLSERWTRTILARLEDLGLIRWTRGTIVAGRPMPSLIRVSKRAIAALVRQGRATKPERDAAHAAETEARIATIRRPTLRPSAPSRRRAELSSTLPPNGEVTVARLTAWAPPEAPAEPISTAKIHDFRAKLRAALAGGQS